MQAGSSRYGGRLPGGRGKACKLEAYATGEGIRLARWKVTSRGREFSGWMIGWSRSEAETAEGNPRPRGICDGAMGGRHCLKGVDGMRERHLSRRSRGLTRVSHRETGSFPRRSSSFNRSLPWHSRPVGRFRIPATEKGGGTAACFAGAGGGNLLSDSMENPDSLVRLRGIVDRLRGPEGCPWDREQTHATLRGALLEEAYETVEAIDRADHLHLAEELGDLLLHVVLHARIAEESGHFDLETIAHGICEKMIRRHPHVFGESPAADTGEVLRRWDEIKRQEKGYTTESLLEGVSQALPALMRAQKIQKRAAHAGFDWPAAADVIEKVREETGEIQAALEEGNTEAVADEIGDLLFSAVNLARKAGLDAEVTLEHATGKFIRRFQEMERAAVTAGHKFSELPLPEQERLWQSAKNLEPLFER